MITIVCPSRYKISRKEIKKAVVELLVSKNISTTSDLNIIFVGKRKMREIASTYKNEDIALPVLAFPYMEDPEDTDEPEHHKDDKFLGEIVLCYPQVVLLAAEKGRRVQEMILRMIDHGLDNIIRHSQKIG